MNLAYLKGFVKPKKVLFAKMIMYIQVVIGIIIGKQNIHDFYESC